MSLSYLMAAQALLLLALAAGNGLAKETAVPPVPAGHPRVYLRGSDLPHLREKLTAPDLAPIWKSVQEAAATSPASGAFVYLVTGDQAVGRAAVTGALAALKASTDARTFDVPLHWGACVYDWCYDLLRPEEKAAFVAEFQRIANLHEPYYPARLDTMSLVGHDSEGWLLSGQLPAGVAIYDESPEMYQAAARLFLTHFVPSRNFHYAAHWHHQGDSYLSRFQHDTAAAWLFRRLGAGDVFSREQQFVPYQFVYNLRPDGQQLRSGDTYDDPGKSESKRLIAMLTGAYYDDPYLLTLADSDLYWRARGLARVLELLFREPGAAKRPLAELPLAKYFPDPGGEMVARTGWSLGPESRDAVVQMRIGGYFFGNHQHRDFGAFQIYYRGALALDSGVYEGEGSGYGSEHWGGYYHQTIAHNGLLIYDPDESGWSYVRPANDGGQRVPNNNADHPRDVEMLQSKGYRMGEVTAHALDPSYSYLAGDLTQAYTGKVRAVTRAMVTLDLHDAQYPAALVVYDRVVAAKPEFRKTWLLHAIQEPQVTDRSITLLRDQDGYHGKLVATSLLPAEATITAVGGPGKEFWVEGAGKNYATTKKAPAEPGAWRVEVSPTQPAAEDRFLHVLTVMDPETPAPSVTLVTGEGLVGAALLDRVVLFAQGEGPADRASFTLTGPQRQVLVCGLAAGPWRVRRDGQEAATHAVTTEGHCLSFEGAAGRYALERIGG
jgi:heparin/heparan-sulfate lyase